MRPASHSEFETPNLCQKDQLKSTCRKAALKMMIKLTEDLSLCEQQKSGCQLKKRMRMMNTSQVTNENCRGKVRSMSEKIFWTYKPHFQKIDIFMFIINRKISQQTNILI